MSDNRPIIIKKIKKGGGHGHHGGAWKIAYADFVTAMMAFFLLMWLLNATSEDQKRGIANYFDPLSMGDRMGGGAGVMGGDSLQSEEASAQASQGDMTIVDSKNKRETEDGTGTPIRPMDPEEAAEDESARLESLKDDIQNAIGKDPELKEWLSNLLIDETPEGLRIQILDQKEKSMFPSGSSTMYDHTRKLLMHVASILRKVPNKLSISGHTDATPYNTRNYTNWELSADRANASRRVLEESGLSGRRFQSVIGRESQELFVSKDPFSPQNRRISIVVLRQIPLSADAVKALTKS